MQVRKQQLELDMEQHRGCILSPCLFNFYAEYIMRNAGLDEAQAGIKIARGNINNLRYADDTTLMAESKELKSLLMKVKSLSCVRLCATPWTAAQAPPSMGFSRQEYSNGVPLPSPMTNLGSILKSRDIALPNRGLYSQSYCFPSSRAWMCNLDHKEG